MAFNLTVSSAGAFLVIGGSGGAGSAIVRGLTKAGAKVAFTYNSNEKKAAAIVNELSAQGAELSARRLDLKDIEDVRRAAGEVVDQYGAIKGVVYASGPRWDPTLRMCDVPPETFKFLVESELIGFFNLISATIGQLRANNGVVVACTTFANQRTFDSDGQSAIPKAGIESFVRQIALEEARYGIRANVIGTGWFNFGLGAIDRSETLLDVQGRSQIPPDLDLESVKWMTNNIHLGNRPGRGEELANAVVFLASEQASYITGQLLGVDGGLSL